jgi:nicotinate-nucleotide adenylyltransferase
MLAPGPGPERLGLLGGTFDPPHVGHLAAARSARDELGLDRVLLVVANDPWQKTPTRRITPSAERLAMVRAAVAGMAGVEVSSAEIDRGGPSYTIETVVGLVEAAARAGRPAPEIFLIVGRDLVATLPTWERPDELCDLVTLAVVARPGAGRPAVPAGWRARYVVGESVDASSSQVRGLVAAGQPVDALVPPAVIHCIRQHNLYAVDR